MNTIAGYKNFWGQGLEIYDEKYKELNEKAKYRNKDWLYKKYIEEGLSRKEIANLCNCGKSTISEWLRKFKINDKLNIYSDYKITLKEIFIRDYGIDGERIDKQYNAKLRIICVECPEYKSCKGKKWKTDLCEPWKYFAEVTGYYKRKEKKR